MNFDRMPTANAYAALTIVSPMMFGEEDKDQHRAQWYGSGQIASVGDGVSSSPWAGEAAELVISHVPIMFEGDIEDNIRRICKLLMFRREEYQQHEIILADGMSPAMQDTLRKVVQEKKARSYQTTLVAAKIVSDEKTVSAHILKCGDSAFFAFSDKGEPISSSLARSYQDDGTARDRKTRCSLSERMRFGPGEQIIVRIDGLLSNDKALAKRTRISKENLKRWRVCTPIQVCGQGIHPIENSSPALHRLSIGPIDRLLVPRCLYGAKLKGKGQRYRVLDYSSTIKVVSMGRTGPDPNTITQAGSTTMVLPDHFYTGQVESYEDRFPLKTHFVLCSDGFYSAFSDARCLWGWLQKNAGALSHKDQRQSVLKKLHSQLNAKSGDDDISFVWAYPSKSDVPGLSRTQKLRVNLWQQKR